jgi:RNA polymerase sigma factor (sigma-70 family)
MLEDKLLILKFKQGSSNALRRIYEKYRLYLLRLAVALLHDTTIAEDIVHDVFIRFARSAEKLRINGNLKSYLRICVINSVHNKNRANQIRSCVELSETDLIISEQDRPDQWIILKEDSLRLNNALSQIPSDQREVVVLHLHGNMTFREIAKLHVISEKTVQSKYRYGLDKLRSILNNEVIK